MEEFDNDAIFDIEDNYWTLKANMKIYIREMNKLYNHYKDNSDERVFNRAFTVLDLLIKHCNDYWSEYSENATSFSSVVIKYEKDIAELYTEFNKLTIAGTNYTNNLDEFILESNVYNKCIYAECSRMISAEYLVNHGMV
jgi:hypothetical protein